MLLEMDPLLLKVTGSKVQSENMFAFSWPLNFYMFFLSFHLWPGPRGPWTEANITQA